MIKEALVNGTEDLRTGKDGRSKRRGEGAKHRTRDVGVGGSEGNEERRLTRGADNKGGGPDSDCSRSRSKGGRRTRGGDKRDAGRTR